jgi:hypothetical protein
LRQLRRMPQYQKPVKPQKPEYAYTKAINEKKRARSPKRV